MAGIRKIQDRYSSDSEQAKRSTQAKFAFIVSNINHLQRYDRTGAHEKFLDEITADVERGAALQDWQVARIEKCYELTMRGLGLPSVPEHQDRRRKGLRY